VWRRAADHPEPKVEERRLRCAGCTGRLRNERSMGQGAEAAPPILLTPDGRTRLGRLIKRDQEVAVQPVLELGDSCSAPAGRKLSSSRVPASRRRLWCRPRSLGASRRLFGRLSCCRLRFSAEVLQPLEGPESRLGDCGFGPSSVSFANTQLPDGRVEVCRRLLAALSVAPRGEQPCQ
jgi:hypothetical protein